MGDPLGEDVMIAGLLLAGLGACVGVSPFGVWFVGGPASARATLSGLDGSGFLWALPFCAAVLVVCGVMLALRAAQRGAAAVAWGAAFLATGCALVASRRRPGAVVIDALGSDRDVALPAQIAPIQVDALAYWTIAAAATAAVVALVSLLARRSA